MVLRSPELLNIIQGLGYSGARILVIDAERRVRAETGATQVVDEGTSSDRRFTLIREAFNRIRPAIHYLTTFEEWQPPATEGHAADVAVDDAIGSSLAGDPRTSTTSCLFSVRRWSR